MLSEHAQQYDNELPESEPQSGPMDPNIKERWVKSLRSGNFTQGAGRLKNYLMTQGPVHCCLGVLCELAVEDGVISEELNYGNAEFIGANGVGVTAFLPVDVMEWAGVTSWNAKYGPGHFEDLTVQNDEKDASFDDIADIIEEKF